MLKKLVSAFLSAVLVLGTATRAASAASYDYNFKAGEYPYYYPPSDAEILHDGHGNFTVEDTRGVITSGDGFISVIEPDGGSSSSLWDGYPGYPESWQGGGAPDGGSYTGLTGMVRPGGVLGELRYRGNTVTVYDGTGDGNLRKGVGHFTGTSYWDGNVAMAGHNRGSSAYFGNLKYLDVGDIVLYSTPLGTRTYQVFSSRKIPVGDFTPLNATNVNMLTLITCVENNPGLRLCVQAAEI